MARYYDPVVGLFLSADTVQSNLLGFNPYAYVGENPETLTDPTGHGWWNWIPQFLRSIPPIVYVIAYMVTMNPAGIGAFLLIGSSILIMNAPPARPHVYSGPTPTPAPTPNPQKPSTSSASSPTPAPSTSAGGVGSRCYNDPRCRNLEASERAGGHTIAQHVQITPEAAKKRATDSAGTNKLQFSSMFKNPSTAQWAVEQVLLSGVVPVMSGRYWTFRAVNVGQPIGTIYAPDGTSYETSRVTVLISPLTDTIFTAYPEDPAAQQQWLRNHKWP